MGTTTEELKKLYSKLGGKDSNIPKASTPGEVLNGINELDLHGGFSGDYNDLTNKPPLGTASPKDVAASGDASSSQVVMGNDSRLTNRRGSTWGQINGTLANQTDLKGELDDIDNRIDSIIALPDGSTTADAELVDIRNGVHGQTFNSAGDAVRASAEQLYNMKTGFDGVVYSSPAAMVQGEDEKLQTGIDATLYSGAFRYISMANYKPKKNVDYPVIADSSNDSISIEYSGQYKAVVYKIPVAMNTDYEFGFSVPSIEGSTGQIGFFDITDKDQTIQIMVHGVYSTGSYTYSLNSGDNDTICIRLGFGNVASSSITYSNLWIYQKNNGMIDKNLLKDGYAADSKSTGEKVRYNEYEKPKYSGWINYYNNTLTYKSGTGWRNSDFIPVKQGDIIEYNNLNYYADPTYSIDVAYIVLFDSSENVLKAYTSPDGSQGTISGVITEFPEGTAFFKFTSKDTSNASVIKKSPVANVVKDNDISIYGYAKKVNVIGDSISQGVGVENTYDDSYAGVLRKMFMIENDGKMNYGFESFPTLSELTTVTNTMVSRISYNNFTRKWNGTDCYGSDEWSSDTDGATFVFKINHPFSYMKISYKEGVTGSFSVKAGNTTLLTVTSTSGTVSPALSSAIDISGYGADQEYTITVISGSVTISGVEIGENAAYPTFNNYGRAGIPIDTVTGTLLQKESECDVLIYALGTNGTVGDSQISMLKSALINNPAKIIILDLCMKSSTTNNIAKSKYLKKLADDIDAEYISMYDLIPTNQSGTTDATYFISDGLHPSPLGHRCIADAVGKKLKLSAQSKGLASAIFTEW